MKKIIPMIIILLMVIIIRGGFMIEENPTTFHYQIGNEKGSIISQKYYRDLKGNWILLDKGRVFSENEIKLIITPNKK